MAVAICGCGVFLLGLADDIWKLRPRWKLVGQITCALIPVSLVFQHPLTGNKAVDAGIALFWMVGITNAFNLLDNINGLSAGTAVVVTGFQAALFLYQDEPIWALMSIAFGGTILGFLVFNFPKGRIFMGDSGSLFIGFWLAAATLTSTEFSGKNTLGLVLFPLLVMVVPICDTTLVTLTRLLRGRPVSVGGTDHLSHRLMAYGLSQKSAALALWGFSLLSGFLGYFAVSYGLSPFLSAATLLLVTVVLFGVYLTRYELRLHFAQPEQATPRPRIAPWVRVSARILLDVILIVAAYYTAYLLRFDGQIGKMDLQLLISTTVELVLIKLCVFVAFGAYRPSWDYFGLKDAYFLVGTSGLASLIAVAYFSAVYRFNGFSRIVIALDFLVFTLLTLAFRFSFRLLDELSPANHRTNVLIYGADSEGETALQVVSKHYRFRVVGFLDDDHAQRNLSIHSIPVHECNNGLEALARRRKVKAVLVTSSATEDTRARLREICRNLNITLLVLRVVLENLQTASPLEDQKSVVAGHTPSKAIHEVAAQKALSRAGSA